MNVQLRAALLMLASTVGFGLMAICIRLASQTEPVAEIAFFRNLFGLLTASVTCAACCAPPSCGAISCAA